MKLDDVTWSENDVNDMLIDVSSCLISVLVRGRNAWHSKWVRHWFHDSHIFTSHASAQLGAENLRGPGNVFYVSDRPALLLTSLQRRVVVFDGFDTDPFARFTGITEDVVPTSYGSYLRGIFPGVTIREAVDRLLPPSSWWPSYYSNNHVRLAEVPDGCSVSPVEASITQFRVSTSVPRGGDRRLGWSRDACHVDPSALEHHVDSWAGLLESAVPAASTLLASPRVLGARLRDRFALSTDPAKRREDLRERYEAEVRDAETALKLAQKASDEADAAESAAYDAWMEAKAFAADPWSAVLDAAASSVAISEARKRAANAQTLLKRAEEAYEQASDEAVRAADQVWDAQDRLDELESEW